MPSTLSVLLELNDLLIHGSERDEGCCPALTASALTALALVLKDLLLGFYVVAKATLKAVEDYHLNECPVLIVPRHEVADELVVRHVFDVVHWFGV